MKRALAALLLVLGAIVIPAGTASAATCDTRSSGRTTGGYYATIWCSGTGFVDGYGATLSDANREALLLYQVYATYGVNCTGRSASTVTGGYGVTLWCSGSGFTDAYGSNLTDAASEARELAILYGTKRQDCTGRSVSRVSGGYGVTLYCSRGGFTDDRGSILTDAQRNARFAASIA